MRSLLAIESLHKFPSISIDFLLAFPQSDLDVDFFMYITLGIGVDKNRGKWVLKLSKSLYGIKQASANWFVIL